MKIPDEIPVMVLPRCILFPQAMLPLYIFEDRYRQMLTDSLAGHRMFCIGTVRRNEKGSDQDESEGIYDVLGVGLVRAAVGNADGTSNLILQGVCRAKVVDMVGGKPYQRANVEPLSSFGGDNVMVDALAAKVAELATIRSKLVTAIPEDVLKFLIALQDPGILSDLVSFTLIEDCHDKQTILETLDLKIRLKKVISLLQREIKRLEILKKLKSDFNDHQASLS